MPSFRFDAYAHEYLDAITGEVLPHITGFLKAGGYIDDRWFKDEHSERGRIVHTLTADYDLGAITDVSSVTSIGKGYLAAHVKAMGILRMEHVHVEVPFVNWRYRFGGRPDRVGRIDGGWAVVDVKSGVKTKAVQVQTALQAILIEPEVGVPARSILRKGLYLRPDGTFKLLPFNDPRDFDAAYGLLRDRYTDARAA